MCNDMKGNIFASKFWISYPDIIQYVIHTLLLFILFFYWEMLEKCFCCNNGTHRGSHRQSPLSRCPSYSAGFHRPHHGRDVTKKGLVPRLICWERHATCVLNVQLWSNLWQQSYSTKVYSAVKYVQRALVFYNVETLLLVLITAAHEFIFVLISAGYPHRHNETYQLLSNSHETGKWC